MVIDVEENKNTPKIRFKGFTEAWEQRKLEDIVDFHRGRGLSWNDIVDNGKNKCILYGNLYTDYGMVIDNVIRSTNNNKKDYFLSEIGDVLIPSSDTTPTGLARASALNLKGIILGGDINVLRPKTVNGPFLSYLINNNKNELIKRIKGTTVRHLNNSDINDMCLHITNKTEEQIKISNLLNNIDTLIVYHQNKYNKFIKIKKSMLEKMFPQDDEIFPKWRFKGFTEAWKQRKFKDYGSVLMCKRIFKYETSDSGDIPFYKIGTFGDKADAFITNEKYEYYKSKFSFPNKGDILLSASGTIGRIVEYTGEKAYFQDSNIVWLNHSNDIKNSFLKVLYPTVKWDGIEGSTIKRLYNSNFLNTDICVPNVEEQEQIGKMFTQIDNLITLHHTKRNKLIEIKKSLLEKMFI